MDRYFWTGPSDTNISNRDQDLSITDMDHYPKKSYVGIDWKLLGIYVPCVLC